MTKLFYIIATILILIYPPQALAFDPFYYTNLITNNRFSDPDDGYNPFFYGMEFAVEEPDINRFVFYDEYSFSGPTNTTYMDVNYPNPSYFFEGFTPGYGFNNPSIVSGVYTPGPYFPAWGY